MILFSSISIFRSVTLINQIQGGNSLQSEELHDTFSDLVYQFVVETGEFPGGFVSAQQRFITQEEMTTIRDARNVATRELERLHREENNAGGWKTGQGLPFGKLTPMATRF